MEIKKYNIELGEDKQCKLIEERNYSYPGSVEFSNPENIAKVICSTLRLDKQIEEHALLLCLTTKNKLIGIFEISHGTNRMTLIDMRSIFIRALMVNASSIIVIHNHPSGDPTPSQEDIKITKKLKDAADLMSIPLLDHIIVCDGCFESMLDKGTL